MYFKYDLKIGLKRIILCILLAGTIAVASGINFRAQILDEKSAGFVLPRELNSMDYFLHIFEGMRPFDPLSDERFQLPVAWLLMNVVLFYFVGKYPYSEIYNNHGASVLLKGGSRKKWYFSKWLWSVLCAVLYYIATYTIVGVFCLVAKIPICFEIKPIEYQNLLTPVFSSTPMDTIKVIALPIIASVTAVSVQLLMSLLTSSFMGFMIMTVLYISSAFYFTPLFIGNLSMLARSDMFCINGIKTIWGIFLSAVITALSLGMGMYFFLKRDIMERK